MKVEYSLKEGLIYFDGEFIEERIVRSLLKGNYKQDAIENYIYRNKADTGINNRYYKSFDASKLRYYVYRMLDSNGNILYIGKTVNIRSRMNQHFKLGSNLTEDKLKMIDKVEFTTFNNKYEMDIYELHLINKLKPPFNIASKGDEEYNFKLMNVIWVTYSDKLSNDAILDISLYVYLYNYVGVGEDNERLNMWGVKADEIITQFNSINRSVELISSTDKQRKYDESHKALIDAVMENDDIPNDLVKHILYNEDAELDNIDTCCYNLNMMLNI